MVAIPVIIVAFLLTTLNAYNDRENHKSADIFGVYLIKRSIVYVNVNWKSKSLFSKTYCRFGTLYCKLFYGASVKCIFNDKQNKTVIFTAKCFIKESMTISRWKNFIWKDMSITIRSLKLFTFQQNAFIIPRFINLVFPGFVARRWFWFHRVCNNSLVFFLNKIFHQ